MNDYFWNGLGNWLEILDAHFVFDFTFESNIDILDLNASWES